MKGIYKQTYSDQITKFIKTSILKGEYRPGDKINEVDLATRLKVSRAPVREALQHLAQTGLLVSIPQRGKFITSLTSKEITDSYFTGGVLEGAAVAAAAPLFTQNDFTTLERLLEDMARHAEESSVPMEKIASLDDAFHDCLFSRCSNTLLHELSRRSCQGISKFLLYKYWCRAFTVNEIYERHKRIFDAVKTGEPALIETALREHYREAGERMAVYGTDMPAGKRPDRQPARRDAV